MEASISAHTRIHVKQYGLSPGTVKFNNVSFRYDNGYMFVEYFSNEIFLLFLFVSDYILSMLVIVLVYMLVVLLVHLFDLLG